ncbi:MAG: outer membrane protein [Idiomarinaceae bacterium HL-53]|nr:MAG: outer membrane protein [Idiomarinaceae bacterium HL-53]CUS48227.1 outer membrane protein [Idiomarinaceae bacterium HL-53]
MRLNKITSTLVASSLFVLCSASAHADWLFGIHAEAQYWQAENDGGFTQNPSDHDWAWDDEGASRLSLNINHFVPFVPNVMVELQNLESSGRAFHMNDLSIRGTTFTTPENAGDMTEFLDSTWDLSHQTYTLYYRLFDNSLIEFYFGVSAKKFDGEVFVTDGATSFQQDFEETIPMGYVRLTAGLPLTGLSIRAQGNPASFGDHDLYDIEASIRYEFLDTMAFDGVVSLGYRQFNLKLDDASGLYSDFSISGPFLNVSLHF